MCHMRTIIVHIEEKPMDDVVMISVLYPGQTFNEMQKYYDQILQNHMNFAGNNSIPYKLYDEELLMKYNLIRHHVSPLDSNAKSINIPYFMPGIGKLYACLQAEKDFPNAKYIMFIDFDSLFLQNANIEQESFYENGKTFRQNKITRSCRQQTYLYDLPYLYHYCMYRKITLEQMNTLHYRYNSGLFIIERDTFNLDMVNEYVNFSYSIHLEKCEWVDMNNLKRNHMNLSYTEVNDNHNPKEHLVFHPSDEVFWQWLHITDPSEISVFNSNWNYLGAPWDIMPDNLTQKQQVEFVQQKFDIIHAHCIDKSNIAKFINYLENK